MGAGAQSRWINIFGGLFVAVVVLLVAPLVERVPMPALAALLIVAGFQGLRVQQAVITWNTSKVASVVMIITFVATLFVPLQFVVLLGMILSIVLHVFRQSNKAVVTQWVLQPQGFPLEQPAPKQVPSNQLTFLHVYGSLFFAAAKSVEEMLPDVDDARHAVVAISLRGQGEIGSTFMTVLKRYAEALQVRDSKLMLVGVDAAARDQLAKTGVLKLIGAENVFLATPQLGGAMNRAVAAAHAWLGQPPDGPTGGMPRNRSDFVAICLSRRNSSSAIGVRVHVNPAGRPLICPAGRLVRTGARPAVRLIFSLAVRLCTHPHLSSEEANVTMKRRFYLTGALVLLLALVASVALVSADQPAAPPAAQAAGTLEGPRWVLVSYADQDGKTIQAIPGTETTAQFANGTVSGSAGCNRYNAPYTVDGNKIQIGLGMSTMMACPPPIMDQEAAYLANLQAAASFKIAGDQLTLANAKGSTVLTFKAEIPISLTDGVWVMTSYNNGKQAVVGALADTEVTAVFGADGRLSGTAGCNTYNAPYTVDGSKIQIGPAISTMMMCPQPIMDQEQRYLAAIQLAATYNIQGTRLELRSADDALLASYAHQPAGAPALVGPTWLMTAYNNGKQAVVSGVADTEVTAVFGADGQLSGSAGCNRYTAPYTVDGDKITIGAAATTMMACEQPIMDQEAQYLAAIQLAATYNVQGSRLDLRSAEDALQATYTRQPGAAVPSATATAPAQPARSPQDTFITLRPTADGVETITLHLDPNGSVEFASSSSDQAPVMQTGTWQSGGDGTLIVTLTDKDGQKLAKPAVATFKFDGPYLTTVDYDKTVFGEQGLKLAQVTDVARKVGPALVTLDLAAGFPLDPTFVSVNGGGEVDASLLSPDCKGFINRNPVVTVNWTGDADLLRGFFYSDSDSTLVVLTPDGKLVCNDNANEQLLDPVLDIKDPVPGKYRIWVGSAANRQRIPGILVLTARPDVNLDTFDLAKLVRRPTIPVTLAKPAPQVAAAAVQQAISETLKTAPTLKSGAPLTANVTTEGDIPLFQFPLTKTCAGLVSAKPSLVFKVAGQPKQVSVLFEGDADASLLVVGDNLKTVECNDDAAAGANLNPLVTLASPAEGAYAVYVGRLDPTKPVKGKLTITDTADAEPAVLAPVKK